MKCELKNEDIFDPAICYTQHVPGTRYAKRNKASEQP